MAIALNIHEFYNELKKAGFNEEQAEVIANIQGKTASATIEQIKQDDLATKKDIEIVRKEIEMVRKEISDSKFESIKWIAAIVLGAGVAQIFAIMGLLKLLGKI
jgi:heterodisulfide reductase subunit A-like polyferredoxin